MQYLLLIMEPAAQRRERSESAGRQLHERMLRFGASLRSRGLFVSSQSLRSDSAAVRVKVRDGKSTLIDGPFAEAKELVGGFFMVDCDDREQAIAVARECPAAEWATIEVRELGPCFT
jgi:hypothetical protein